jgi:hypothetical protein
MSEGPKAKQHQHRTKCSDHLSSHVCVLSRCEALGQITPPRPLALLLFDGERSPPCCEDQLGSLPKCVDSSFPLT